MRPLNIPANNLSETTESPRFMNVKQVAEYLKLNEKKVYALVSEGKIPGTKITGKWMFPRALIDQWLLESSHGGLLTDRLIVAGSDDPLVQRAIMQLANNIQARALVSYSCTGTRLGLSLLAHHRADVSAMHWGPFDESYLRHPALLNQFPQHHDWVLVRLFKREQGLIVHNDISHNNEADLEKIIHSDLNWCARQEGSGSQRFLLETLHHFNMNETQLNVSCTALSESDAAAKISMRQADIAPGTHSVATQYSLGFIPIGWEAFDLALYRGVYFRTLFQELLEEIKSEDCQALATRLGGYNFSELGKLVWSE